MSGFNSIRSDLADAYNAPILSLRSDFDLADDERNDLSETIEPLRHSIQRALLFGNGEINPMPDKLAELETSNIEEA